MMQRNQTDVWERKLADVLSSKPTKVGLNMAAFALETLEPSDELKHRVSLTDIWNAYRNWCLKSRAAPIAYPIFIEHFDRVATDVGLTYYQRGSHRLYLHVRLKEQQ